MQGRIQLHALPELAEMWNTLEPAERREFKERAEVDRDLVRALAEATEHRKTIETLLKRLEDQQQAPYRGPVLVLRLDHTKKA